MGSTSNYLADLLNSTWQEKFPPNMSVPPANYREISQTNPLSPYASAVSSELNTSIRTSADPAQQAKSLLNTFAPTSQIPQVIDAKKAAELKQKTGNKKKKAPQKNSSSTPPAAPPSNNSGADVTTPKETEIDKELRKYKETALTMADKIDAQNPALLDFQKQIVANKYNGVDISPLMAYFDAQLGTNTMKGYNAPTSEKADELLKEASKKYEENASTASAIRLNADKVALETAKEKRKMELDQQLTQTKYLLDSNKLDKQQVIDLVKVGADYKAAMAALAQKAEDEKNKDSKKEPIGKNPSLYNALTDVKIAFHKVKALNEDIAKNPSLISSIPGQSLVDTALILGRGTANQFGLKADFGQASEDRKNIASRLAEIKAQILKAQQGGRVSTFDAVEFDKQVIDVYKTNPSMAIKNLNRIMADLKYKHNLDMAQLSNAWDMTGMSDITEGPTEIPVMNNSSTAPKKEAPVFKDHSTMTTQEIMDEATKLREENSKAGK